MALIEFTGGVSIVPNSAGTGAGVYNLVSGAGGYNPAINTGTITFPNHTTNVGESDPNLILTDASIYINLTDANSVDRTTILTSMTTNSGTIRFSQNVYHIEFSFTPGAFRIYSSGGNDISVFWDNIPTIPTGTLSLVSSSGFTFTDGPVTITIDI